MSELPLTPEEIGPGWLSQALAAAFPGVRVAAVEVADAHAGTTGRARLRLRYARAAGAPETLFVKLPPRDPAQREMVRSTGMGRREARFYAELAGEVPVRIPRVHFAAWNPEGTRYVMLLEDLAASGCRFQGALPGASLAYTRAVLTSLARLHARFWDDARFAGELAWVEPAPRHPIGVLLVKAALERHAAELPPAFAGFGRLYVEHSAGVYDLWDEGVPTLVHGDAHVGNLFADGEAAGFLDWACLSRTPGVRDVSYFLSNSIEAELRRAHERELLRLYLDALAEAGVAEPPSFEDTWRRHRRHVAYSWVAATTTFAMGDRWQPLAAGRRAVERTTAALTDLGTVELLREELGW